MLSQRVVNALKADPRTIDLRSQAPHFYDLGARILELFEGDEIVDVLIEVRNYILNHILRVPFFFFFLFSVEGLIWHPCLRHSNPEQPKLPIMPTISAQELWAMVQLTSCGG